MFTAALEFYAYLCRSNAVLLLVGPEESGNERSVDDDEDAWSEISENGENIFDRIADLSEDDTYDSEGTFDDDW